MKQYVEYLANFLLVHLGFPVLYGQTNPVRMVYVSYHRVLISRVVQFPFMEGTAIPARANFFERPVSDYHGAAIGDMGGSRREYM